MTKIKLLFTLAIGVLLGIVSCEENDQSQLDTPDEEPIESTENQDRKRRLATPEVVLHLKYNRGELNRIYLTQFRKEKDVDVPSVPARLNLCADLCHAGLGGEACGSSCSIMMPVGLQQALASSNQSDAVFGEPRFQVCPTLCMNRLGEPLCNCVSQPQSAGLVDWNSVCTAFCDADNYVLGGCPACQETASHSDVQTAMSRILNTSEGWTAWCNVQCQQGQGGAACNCDRAPF